MPVPCRLTSETTPPWARAAIGVSAGVCTSATGEQVREHLAELAFLAVDGEIRITGDGDLARGVDGSRVAHRVLRERRHVHLRALDGTTLLEFATTDTPAPAAGDENCPKNEWFQRTRPRWGRRIRPPTSPTATTDAFDSWGAA